MGDLIYAVRGSSGFSLNRGLTSPEVILQEKLNPRDAHCRCLTFSNDGKYFAFCDSTRTVIVNSVTGVEHFSAELGKTQCIIFSPKDLYVVTYEPYVIYGQRKNDDGTVKVPNPNLRFWSTKNGTLLATHIADKQAKWRPQFTEDDTLALRLHGSEFLFHENGNFERYSKKVAVKDLGSFVLSPGQRSYIAAFIPPIKGQPAVIQLRNLDDSLSILSSKISFNCDRCVMNWNAKGTAFLATVSVEVDKSNQSYYGVSQLICMTLRDNYNVPLDKQGPIHSVEWAPSSKEFAVCYGFMPSKVTVFNLKGDVLWELGEGHRNELHYNPQSTILVTAGFGNVSSGRMQFWNLATRKEISRMEVPHTTHFEFAPDGQHFCTSTTAPRLKIDNGYKIWHYSGALLYEKKFEKEELWQVKWWPCTAYNKFEIEEPSKAQSQKTANANRAVAAGNATPMDYLPAGAINKQGAYVPPHLRKKGPDGQTPASGGATARSSDKPAENDLDKKIKTLMKKLDDIGKLKEKEKNGVKLELNQMEKVQAEPKLRKELEQLKLDQLNAKLSEYGKLN